MVGACCTYFVLILAISVVAPVPEITGNVGFWIKQAYGGLKEPIGDADTMFGSKFVVTSTKVLNLFSGIFLPYRVACKGFADIHILRLSRN